MGYSQRQYVRKHVDGGIATYEVRPSLVTRTVNGVASIPRRTYNTAVAFTEPANNGFGGSISQNQMVQGRANYTLIDRSKNLVVNSTETVSNAGGAVVNTTIGTGRQLLRAVWPY